MAYSGNWGGGSMRPVSLPDRALRQPAATGAREEGGGLRAHFSRPRDLAHERAVTPTGATRRGRGVSPGLAMAWHGVMGFSEKRRYRPVGTSIIRNKSPSLEIDYAFPEIGIYVGRRSNSPIEWPTFWAGWWGPNHFSKL